VANKLAAAGDDEAGVAAQAKADREHAAGLITADAVAGLIEQVVGEHDAVALGADIDHREVDLAGDGHQLDGPGRDAGRFGDRLEKGSPCPGPQGGGHPGDQRLEATCPHRATSPMPAAISSSAGPLPCTSWYSLVPSSTGPDLVIVAVMVATPGRALVDARGRWHRGLAAGARHRRADGR
jgi:hypothetical protein